MAEITTPPMSPVDSPESSTTSSPSSSTESSPFSVPALNSHRDSVSTTSTTSTALSSVESTPTSDSEGDQKDQDQPPCSSCGRRPTLQTANTTSAVLTTASLTRPPSSSSSFPSSNEKDAADTPSPTTSTTTVITNTTTTTRLLPKQVKHDPLSRTFPKPTCAATIEELLARDPGRWSLNHWIKRGAEVRQDPAAVVVDKEAAARRFAETKAALLKSHQEIGKVLASTSSRGGRDRDQDRGSGSNSAPPVADGRTPTD